MRMIDTGNNCNGTPMYNKETEYCLKQSKTMKMQAAEETGESFPKEVETEQTGTSTRKSIVLLFGIFLTSLSILALVYTTFPELEESEQRYVKLPRDIDDAKNLGKVLSNYKEKYNYQVLGAVFVTYIFLQSFAIPGSIFLSILSGFLFPFPLALFMVCTCSAIGASLCFFLSALIGRRVLFKYAGERVKSWAATVQKNRDHMLNYIIFLRITPILPNWFINLCAPLLGVDLWPFFFGTFLGVAPPSFVAISAGTTLHQLTSSRDALSFNSILVLCLLAVFSLLPILMKNKLKSKFE
ncbi:transmembrane protein 41B-like isoform X1 [Artemia franciscana]|uniref:VTT domain-containing protein n=1 Tax=Artemia franciscana TaxID=6661 RepID=A0AA88HSS8_ARTSF|nr:hypothetical protein QYM36_009940 [Artemia franciscana]